ncbi:MAG: lysophospholipid acyltransferase family protein [Candidatus Kapaibacterium sp.]
MSRQPFIPARPRTLDRRFWGAYFSWTLRRHFSSGYIAGEHHLLQLNDNDDNVPTIVASTHASWWDAAVAMSLAFSRHRLDTDGMMEYRQLQRYRFFSRLGMFSVVREDPLSAMSTLRYAASRLTNTNRMLWMYPQGTLIHQDVPTIDCEPGIGILTRMTGRCRILPVAMRYELLREQRPVCWVRFGEPLTIDCDTPIRTVQSMCSGSLTDLRDELRKDAMTEYHAPYDQFITGPRSMEKRFDALLGRKP